MHRKTFAAGMALLASVFEKLERVTTDKFLSEQWYKMLSDLTDEQFKYAVEVIVKTQKFAPTISEIRKKAVEFNHQFDLTPEEAWTIVYRDVQEKGYYREPVYDDWKLEAVKEAIGWKSLCDMTVETKPILRAQFMKMYEAFSQRQKQVETLKSPQLEQFVSQLVVRLGGAKSEKALPSGK